MVDKSLDQSYCIKTKETSALPAHVEQIIMWRQNLCRADIYVSWPHHSLQEYNKLSIAELGEWQQWSNLKFADVSIHTDIVRRMWDARCALFFLLWTLQMTQTSYSPVYVVSIMIDQGRRCSNGGRGPLWIERMTACSEAEQAFSSDTALKQRKWLYWCGGVVTVRWWNMLQHQFE